MSEFLFGVPGKLKSISDWLTTYWTSARAAKLDFLTANVAVASTAVSNADYTAARAAKLDAIPATGIGIKSVQRGVTTTVGNTDVNVTISAVNLSKTFVNVNVKSGVDNGGTGNPGHPNVSLTTTTNLKITGHSAYNGGGQYPIVAWEVIEFY